MSDMSVEDEQLFLQAVGVLEDVVMRPSFRDAVEAFCKSNCGMCR